MTLIWRWFFEVGSVSIFNGPNSRHFWPRQDMTFKYGQFWFSTHFCIEWIHYLRHRMTISTPVFLPKTHENHAVLLWLDLRKYASFWKTNDTIRFLSSFLIDLHVWNVKIWSTLCKIHAFYDPTKRTGERPIFVHTPKNHGHLNQIWTFHHI